MDHNHPSLERFPGNPAFLASDSWRTWRPHPDCPDEYLVNRCGAIKSRPRTVPAPDGKVRAVKPRILKPVLYKRGVGAGYSLAVGGQIISSSRGRVVQDAFGSAPDPWPWLEQEQRFSKIRRGGT